jgi:hypothetical protein
LLILIIDLQENYSNFKLNTDTTKYRVIFLSSFFLICTVNIFFIAVSPVKLIMTNSYLSVNEKLSKKDHNLELNADESTPVSPGLKVEIVAISGPVSFDSGDNHLSNSNYLSNIYSKKKYSLTYQCNQLISKTFHLSRLITKLQI